MRPEERESSWDYIRATLMLLGIPFHAAHPVSYEGWSVRSDSHAMVFDALIIVVHQFRMEGFYIVAGYFAAMLLSRKPPVVWFKTRLVRLGLPLITCMILLNPFQMLATAIFEARQHGWDWNVVLANTIQYLSVLDFRWIRHLWFLIVLLEFSFLLFALHKSGWIKPIQARMDRVLQGRTIKLRFVLIALYCAAAVTAICAELVLRRYESYPHIVQQMLSLTIVTEFIRFLPWFLIGYVFFRHRNALNAFRQVGQISLAILAILLSAFVAIELAAITGHFAKGYLTNLSELLLGPAVSVLCCAFIYKGFGKLHRHGRVVQYFVDASFTIYLFHQPVIMMAFVLFMQDITNPYLIFILLCASAMGVSMLADLLIRQSVTASYMFNGKRPVRVLAREAPAVRPL
ncbi:acyltransferase family protein [Hyphomonas oceanitis]|uniref:acyltransferase family protein n=1 Tax=Hyphomonas oceanitis TaxID=81033 RepID=UPI00300324C2